MKYDDLIRRQVQLEREIERLSALEFASGQDPIWAYTRALTYLKSRSGPRAIWGNYAKNLYTNNRFHLTAVNETPTYPLAYIDSTRLYPYIKLRDAQGQYLYNNSENNLWTVDPGVDDWNADVGLTVGAWLRLTAHPSDTQGILADWSPAGVGFSWVLYINDSGTPVDNLNFSVSTDGTSVNTNIAGSTSLPTGRWILVVARWIPSTSMTSWLFDGDYTVDETEDVTSIPSAIFNNTGTHYGFLGNYQSSGPTDHTLNGDMGLAWFHVGAWSDAEVKKFHYLTRPIYGV